MFPVTTYFTVSQSRVTLITAGAKFPASSVSAHDFSALYTTLPHNIIKKITELIEQTFN